MPKSTTAITPKQVCQHSDATYTPGGITQTRFLIARKRSLCPDCRARIVTRRCRCIDGAKFFRRAFVGRRCR